MTPGVLGRLATANVLIVDQAGECGEVMRTVLEGRGYRTVVAGNARLGLEMLRDYRPDVVVLDLDDESAWEEGVREQFDSGTRAQDAQLLVLGWPTRAGDPSRADRLIAKPYHFAPLIRTIEELVRR